MALINGNIQTKKEKIKANINVEIASKITEYCTWANIDDIGFFIEEAARFVFSKDKEWKEHQRGVKRSLKNK
tara:strand:- start:1494 stop:1709 length:216 start_codon:yes stop_codon:yes gene_type:complete